MKTGAISLWSHATASAEADAEIVMLHEVAWLFIAKIKQHWYSPTAHPVKTMRGKNLVRSMRKGCFFDISWILWRRLVLLWQKGKYCIAAPRQHDSPWISKARFLCLLTICFDWHTGVSEHPQSLLAVKNLENPSESDYNPQQLWDSLWMNRDSSLHFCVCAWFIGITFQALQ